MRKYFGIILFIAFSVIGTGIVHGQSILKFDEKEGLFKVQHRTADIISAKFVFWYGKWKWAGMHFRGRIEGNGTYSLSGSSPATGLEVKAKVISHAKNEMTWDLELKNLKKISNNGWGGLEFRINNTGLIEKGFKPVAQLMADNQGWSLKLQPDQPPLTVTFDPPLEKLHFEHGQKNRIRAYFLPGKLEKAGHRLKMTVSLPPEGRVVKTFAERLQKPSKKDWYHNLIVWNQSPVDMSFLNANERPAGIRGPLMAIGESLVFEDGTKARFWGTNLTAAALFRTSELNIRSQAQRLSRLGFNLVRLHHHDSNWVHPNIFGDKPKNTLSLDPKSLKKLDLWIKALKDEGIYIWLDLHVGRSFSAADNIRNFSEIAKGRKTNRVKGFSYINSDIQDRFQEFNEAYLSHVNPYTSLAYKDDPAIAGVLITNENDLTHHYGNALLPDKKVPAHNKTYMALARQFADKTGLSSKKTWRSWEHGPSKLFLSDLEHQFNKKMISQLHRLGVKVPIATTNSWGGMPLSGLPSLTDGDIIDAHSYGRPDVFSSNPRHKSNFTHWIAAASVAGKPLTVTEWNVSPYPSFDRSGIPTYLASLASLQDWDALMQYAYAQVSLNRPSYPGNWHAFNDSSLLAMMPAAALLYRQRHVEEARKTYHITLTGDVLAGQKISPVTSAALRTLAEQSKLRIALPKIKELPWLTPSPTQPNAIAVRDPGLDFIPGKQNYICSDTQEICRNWQDGVATINTEKSQIASGWIGGHKIELRDVSFQIKTANASIAVQSLDNSALSKSSKILISMAAQSVPVGWKKLPLLSEPIEGILHIQAQEGLKLYALGSAGQRRELKVQRDKGRYIIPLDASLRTYWLMLDR